MLVICLYLAGCGKDKQPVHILENNTERSGRYAAATYSPVDLSNFAKKNIFGLIKKPKPEPVPPPKKIGAPQLQGISTLYSPPKAVLRMSKAGGGKARSVFLGPEESKDGVEVISVDVATSTVVVKVGEHTYVLKIENPKLASKPVLGRRSRSPDAPRTTGPSRPGSSG